MGLMQTSGDVNRKEDISLNKEEAEELAKALKVQLELGEIPNQDELNIRLMIAGLADPRGLLRRTFAESLGMVGKAAMPGLREALLENKNVIVRRAAAKTLKLVGEASALPYLLEALINDRDPVVQCSSAGAMAIFGESAVKHLLKVLENPESTSMQCGLATWGLAFVGAEASESLKEAAKSKNSLIRSAAIAALEDQINSLKDEEARELLVQAVNDRSVKVQSEAIRLIGKLTDKTWSMPILINKLNDNESEIRKKAAISLMQMNDINTIESLRERISQEEDNDVLNVLKLAINQIIKMN